MKQILNLLILLNCISGFTQDSIFKDFDFQSGEYALIFVDVTGEEQGVYSKNKRELRKSNKQIALIDSEVHFIIDSISTLKSIKESWFGKKNDVMYFCWYDYFIYLTKNDSVVSKMKVNFKCSELISDNQHYVFDSVNVTNFLGHADTVVKTLYRFGDNKRKALKYWRKIEADTSIVLRSLDKPLWVDFEGSFQIEYTDSSDALGVPINNLIEDKIQSKYPDEYFMLKWASTSVGKNDEPNTHVYDVICNKSLYDNFNLFKLFRQWGFYEEYRMVLYRRKPNR